MSYLDKMEEVIETYKILKNYASGGSLAEKFLGEIFGANFSDIDEIIKKYSNIA